MQQAVGRATVQTCLRAPDLLRLRPCLSPAPAYHLPSATPQHHHSLRAQVRLLGLLGLLGELALALGSLGGCALRRAVLLVIILIHHRMPGPLAAAHLQAKHFQGG